MRLVVIYGPPAVGKFTVTKELQKLTGYKLFHNHLTFDLIGSLFSVDADIFFRLNNKVRLDLIEAAAKHRTDGVVMTFCYAHPKDNRFIRQVIKRMEKHGGRVCWVQLTCEREELFTRVKSSSRRHFGKLKTVKGMKEVLRKWDLLTPIPFTKNLCIDNTRLSPKKVAQKIKTYYKL